MYKNELIKICLLRFSVHKKYRKQSNDSLLKHLQNINFSYGDYYAMYLLIKKKKNVLLT